MLIMPTLETPRLLVRPLVADDLAAVHRLLDHDLADTEPGGDPPLDQAARAAWLAWTIQSYDQLAALYQPPFGDRAVVLRETGALIGLAGLTPALNAYGRLPGFPNAPYEGQRVEVGLYYALAPAHQGQGYATEAARALIDYAFAALALRQIVATTTHDNVASAAVMARLGMRLFRHPSEEPPWLQVVGLLVRGDD